MRLGHVHLKVRDLNCSIRFYTSVLDMRLTEHTGRYAFLAIGTEHYSLALEEIGAWAVAPARHAVGLAHVAFEVPNRLAFVAAHDRLLKASIPLICGDKGISWAMRFEDPDGNEIEIYLDRRRTLDGKISALDCRRGEAACMTAAARLRLRSARHPAGFLRAKGETAASNHRTAKRNEIGYLFFFSGGEVFRVHSSIGRHWVLKPLAP